MGSVSVPVALEIAAATAAAGTAVSAYSSYQAGQATKAQDKQKATQAGLDSGQKQIDIRQNMLRALASQNAQAGVGGIGTGGSFGANVNRQITQNQSDLATLSTDTITQQQLYAEAGNSAATTGALQAGSSLLDFAGSNSGLTLMAGPNATANGRAAMAASGNG
jgi:hypothetical protein